MTAQINDTILYQNEEYALAGINGAGLFVPQELGLETAAACTACWRGYLCQYEVADGRLRLRQLSISFPRPTMNAIERGEPSPTVLGKPGRVEPGRWYCLYEDLRTEMPFSGGLLLGAGFIRELYVHMGFHPAWKYRKVCELSFDQGGLTAARDRSAEMARCREELAGQPLGPDDEQPEAVRGWIQQCFRRDYR